MPPANTTATYGTVARTLHWLAAALILAAVALALYMERLPRGSDAEVARVSALYSLHKTIGIAAFATALARILWAWLQPKPAPLHPERRAETFAAEAVHWSLYAAMLVMPLSGWLYHAATDGFAPILWPFGQSLPFVPKSPALAMTFRAIHGLSAKLLYASLALHVLGALKHGLIDRDGTMARMVTGRVRALPGGPETRLSRWPAMAALALWAALVAVPLALPPPPARSTAPAPAAAGGNWTVSQGTLAITIRQSQAPIPGSITGWSAAITYDDQSRTGTVLVTIPLARLTIGSVTPQALGPEFLDAARFPTATFRATIAETGGRLTATGPLSLHGREVPVSLPFTLDIRGDHATMSGQVTLDRRDFGIGANFRDEATVAFPVTIDVTLMAVRK